MTFSPYFNDYVNTTTYSHYMQHYYKLCERKWQPKCVAVQTACRFVHCVFVVTFISGGVSDKQA